MLNALQTLWVLTESTLLDFGTFIASRGCCFEIVMRFVPYNKLP